MMLFWKGERILFLRGENPLPPRLPEFPALTLHLDNCFFTKTSYGGTDTVAGRPDTIGSNRQALGHTLGRSQGRKLVELSGIAS